MTPGDRSLMDGVAPGFHTEKVMDDLAFEEKLKKLWALKQAAQPGQIHALPEEHRPYGRSKAA